METLTKKSNGKPFRKGGTRTYQRSTTHHTTKVEAYKKGWVRCPGELEVDVRMTGGGCPCCEGPEIDIEFSCSVCRYRGGIWTITGIMYDEGNQKFLEDTIMAHYKM